MLLQSIDDVTIAPATMGLERGLGGLGGQRKWQSWLMTTLTIRRLTLVLPRSTLDGQRSELLQRVAW